MKKQKKSLGTWRFDLRKISMSTLFPLSEDTISPAAENTLSEGTDVEGFPQ